MGYLSVFECMLNIYYFIYHCYSAQYLCSINDMTKFSTKVQET